MAVGFSLFVLSSFLFSGGSLLRFNTLRQDTGQRPYCVCVTVWAWNQGSVLISSFGFCCNVQPFWTQLSLLISAERTYYCSNPSSYAHCIFNIYYNIQPVFFLFVFFTPIYLSWSGRLFNMQIFLSLYLCNSMFLIFVFSIPLIFVFLLSLYTGHLWTNTAAVWAWSVSKHTLSVCWNHSVML